MNYAMWTWSKEQKKIAIGCLGKNLVIHTENLEYFEKIPTIEF